MSRPSGPFAFPTVRNIAGPGLAASQQRVWIVSAISIPVAADVRRGGPPSFSLLSAAGPDWWRRISFVVAAMNCRRVERHVRYNNEVQICSNNVIK